MNVDEMIDNVNAECHPITNIDTIIRRWLDRGQKVIASKRDWFWLRQYQYSISTVSGTDAYALSPLVDTSKVITLYSTDLPRHIPNVTEQQARRFDPGSDGTGDPYQYSIIRFDPVQNQPSSASVLTFVSDTADTATIRVQGLDGSSVMVQETVTLNGTTPVLTTASFTQVMSLSKSATTTGQVTCTSNSGGVTNVVIPANERTMSHPVIRVENAPDSVDTLYYDFTMKLPPEQYHDVIELYAIRRCWAHLNNPANEQIAFAEFQSRVEDMKRDDHQPNGITTLDSVTGPDGRFVTQLPAWYPRTSD
jgi:hypothetical protein